MENFSRPLWEHRREVYYPPLLANIALHGLEDCLNISYHEYHSKKGYTTFITKGKYRVVRYADDFVRQDGSLSSF